jgi:hypothetical protein
MPNAEGLFSDEEKAIAEAELQLDGLVDYTPEGYFSLTDKGWEYGQELLKKIPSCKDQIILLILASQAIEQVEEENNDS